MVVSYENVKDIVAHSTQWSEPGALDKYYSKLEIRRFKYHLFVSPLTPIFSLAMKLQLNRRCSALAFLLFIMTPLVAFSQPSLTKDAAKSFLDFYYNGQGSGVILADSQLCTEISENECVDPVSPIALQNGVTYNFWMMFVVPQGDEIDGLLVQFNQSGITRSTREISVSGSIRYRTWRGFTPNRTGNWEIVVLHDTGDEVRTLETIVVTVNE